MREDTTHMRVMEKTLRKIRLMSAVEGRQQLLILDESINKREKDLHGGNIESRARDLGVGESE